MGRRLPAVFNRGMQWSLASRSKFATVLSESQFLAEVIALADTGAFTRVGALRDVVKKRWPEEASIWLAPDV